MREFISKNRRHIPTIALMLGFVWDWLTLGRPDRLFDNAVLLTYLVLVGAAILIMARRRERGEVQTPLPLLIFIQFVFGNLTSGLFVLYGTSGTLVGNWLFFLIFVGFLIGNEFMRDRYGVVRFNISVYYLLVFSYLVLIVPVIVRTMGASVFLLSGAASIAIISIYIVIGQILAPRTMSQNKRYVTIAIAGIFFAFNLLYFSNLIPPVPLALKDMGVYHRIIKADDGRYLVTYEKGKWFQFLKRSDDTFHYQAGESAYCMSSVFAPSGIKTPVYHRWEYFDRTAIRWVTASYVEFSIVGGRDEGYRGYSIKNNLTPGAWRCSVETERGALIGRRTFEAVPVTAKPDFMVGVR